jgi:hypothetical protein
LEKQHQEREDRFREVEDLYRKERKKRGLEDLPMAA